jgi:hypothetical protein
MELFFTREIKSIHVLRDGRVSREEDRVLRDCNQLGP